MFCGTDNIMHNILHIQSEWDIQHNIVSPAKQCHGFE